ncbi:MAG TPA: flagellar basal body-associated FliL family protein [Pseudomonadales bacterium]|nr:flagellar basal body-associated FliL family protein [Pseudomonadales bacterium]
MADEDNAPQDQEGAAPKKSPAETVKALLGKPIIRMVLLVLVLLMLLAGTSFATLSYLGVFDTPPDAQNTSEEVAQAGSGEASEPSEGSVSSVNYYPLEPEFVVNFMARGRQRYMQLGLSLKIVDANGIAQVENHEPLLRNKIVILLSAQDYLSLQSDEGRLALRKQLLTEIRQLMTQETGQPIVDEVYFTSYVLQ